MLATLDPTFAAADVKQIKQQVAGLRAQIARDDAQLNDQPFWLRRRLIPMPSGRRRCKRNTTINRSLNIRRSSRALPRRSARLRRQYRNTKRMHARYQQREQIAKQIEDMRATLAAHGTGSQLNLLTSQDARLEVLRTLEYDHNSLDRGATYVGFYDRRP